MIDYDIFLIQTNNTIKIAQLNNKQLKFIFEINDYSNMKQPNYINLIGIIKQSSYLNLRHPQRLAYKNNFVFDRISNSST